MRIIDGTLETVAGNDMGIFWCTVPAPADFILKLQWLRLTADSNSGVYLRFPDPESKGYNNTAFVADDFGFEVQIDELGAPDGLAIHRTGAIYRKDNRTDNKTLTQRPARGVGEWNDYEIRVQGQTYTVTLNGDQVCVFDNTNLYPQRGKPTTPAAPSYIASWRAGRPDHRVASARPMRPPPPRSTRIRHSRHAFLRPRRLGPEYDERGWRAPSTRRAWSTGRRARLAPRGANAVARGAKRPHQKHSSGLQNTNNVPLDAPRR